MGTRQKLSVTIGRETLRAIEKASEVCSVPKSRLAEEAFKLWLRKRNRELMAKAYEEMAQEDRESAELTFEAQREIRK